MRKQASKIFQTCQITEVKLKLLYDDVHKEEVDPMSPPSLYF